MVIIVKATCAGCKRLRKIRKDGMVRIHRESEMHPPGPNNLICVGSEEPPVPAKEGQYFCNVGCSGCDDIIKYGI